MKKLVTISEYEKIFAADCEFFDELVKYLGASEFLSLGWQKNGGKFIQAKNYVGTIRLPSGFQIEILPKIYKHEGDEENLRGLVMKMIHALMKGGKKFPDAELKTSRLNLFEIFIKTYLEMVLELVKRGLKSTYTVREENLNFFKGKLLANRNLRRNFAHMEKFFVSFDEYNINRAEHRLIKAALIKLRQMTQENKRLASKLLAEFDSVEPSSNFQKDSAQIFIDKQNREYQSVMEWTKIFLAGENFTPFAGKARAMTLLFDMNKLFEVYVALHIKKYFSERFKVKIQAREKFLFDTPRSFKLQPDIILENSAEKFILDTKWKLEITAGDMYQMLAYAKRYDTKKNFLICPPQVAGNVFYRSEDFEVQIFCVNLFDMENLRGLAI